MNHKAPKIPSYSALWWTASNISSFDQKPEKKGTPAIDNTPRPIVTEVIGISFLKPPISLMSCVWTACITAPDPKNNKALKNAWFIRWNKPAMYPWELPGSMPKSAECQKAQAPVPNARNIYPNWDIVE